MKKYIARILCFVMVMAMLAGCGTEQGNSGTNNKAGYTLTVNGKQLYIDGSAELTEDIGTPQGGTYEALSCVFEGKDTFYYYDGFTVQTYEKDGKKYIYAITIEDDTVKTDEGVKIGDSFAEVTGSYGTGYTAAGNAYTYAKDNMTLTFTIENDKVAGISYMIVR